MLRLFLDANILLDFFRYGQDDIEEIRKLITLIDENEIEFFCNDLLRDEVYRARDGVISSSLSEIESTKFHIRAPKYCHGMAELKQLQITLKTAGDLHKKLASNLKSTIRAENLAADLLLKDLFRKAIKIEMGEKIREQANYRLQVNNPPRKSKDSIADALHWESLLAAPVGYNFHLVSRDGDFASDLEPSEIKEFLREEWKNKHGKYADIELHKSLGGFFRENFPQIKLSSVSETNALIERLGASPNFLTTHEVIDELTSLDEFTNRQVARLFEI